MNDSMKVHTSQDVLNDHFAEVEGLEQEIATLTARVAELEGVLRSLKPASHYESEDPWYSCPKANKPRHAYTGEPYCDCGADDTNAKIDACLAGADPEKQP